MGGEGDYIPIIYLLLHCHHQKQIWRMVDGSGVCRVERMRSCDWPIRTLARERLT